MTGVPRLFIRSALVYFVLGFLMGGAFMLYEAVTGAPVAHVFVTEHAHILLVGFFTNMVIGVAYWMFPRPRGAGYREWLSVASYWLLNGGLWLRVVAEPAYTFWGGGLWAAAMGLAGLLQVAGGLAFVVNIWTRVASPRIGPQGSATRPGGQQ